MNRFALLLCLPISTAGAQVVSGTVTSAGSPVANAQVSFVAAADSTRRFDLLTRSDGSFGGVVPIVGQAMVGVRAIGYQPARRAVELGRDGTRALSLEVESLDIQLTDIEALASRGRCGPLGTGGEGFAQLLDAIRTTGEVIALHLATRSGRFRIEQTRTTVVLLAGGDSSVRKTTAQGGLTSWPIMAPATTVLQQEGFARPRSGAEGPGWNFYGPDLAVLSSDWFLSTHCFRADNSSDESDALLLRFEPDDPGDLVDIDGVLIINREDWTLRRLEFRHVNLPREFADRGSGGWLTFGRLDDGTWYPDAWSIRGLIEREGGVARPILGNIVPRVHSSSAVAGYVEQQGRVVAVDNGQEQPR